MDAYERIAQLRATGDPASKIVVAIWSDVTDRKGIANEIEACDDEIQVEMIDAWICKVRDVLTGAA